MNVNNIKQFVLSKIGSNLTPIQKNLVQMAENNETDKLEKFARNFCKERGIDFDKEIKEFQSIFNLMK